MDTSFSKLLHDAQEKLFLESGLSRLAAIVKLLLLKLMYRWSNASFDALVDFLGELIPSAKKDIPNFFYSCQKYVSDLGLTYVKYDICKYNCVVYWESLIDAQCCPVCRSSRWKDSVETTIRKNIPHKVLRYFSIKPRLQKLYMSSDIAEHMRWHYNKREDDGEMRHPANTLA